MPRGPGNIVRSELFSTRIESITRKEYKFKLKKEKNWFVKYNEWNE